MKNSKRTAVGLRLLGQCTLGASGLMSVACLPEDTRPVPTTIRTQLALGPQTDSDLADGLTVATADGYEVTFERILMSFGRVTFYGDDCNLYGAEAGFYSRVLDPLQPGEQPVSQNYAVGQCEMQFRLYPPEDWTHVGNPGVTEQDRDSLRAIDFPPEEVSAGREGLDDLSGPRGPKGASLRMIGTARNTAAEEAPTAFVFEFGMPSFHPDCHPPGQERFELSEDGDLSLVVEMLPEQLFGTCGDASELRFAPIARARALTEPDQPVTLDTLRDVKVAELSDAAEAAFYTCDRDFVLPPQDLRQWLALRASFDLFGLRNAECVPQPPTFQEQF